MRGFFTRLLEKVICSSKKLVTLYGKYYNKIVEREACLADLDESHKVLCVGGGSVPWTAMLFALLTGAEIDVVDIDHQAVYNGQKVVKMFDLQNKVRVMRSNGLWIDAVTYDAVHIALQVSPKAEVLDHLNSCCRPGTKIIMRMPKESLAYDYSHISQRQLKKYNWVKADVSTTYNTMSDSLLMVKTQC
ncbi:MAG: hypothetical protein GX260_02835 [Tissierellia bacterium]|nr:hypothetical protein [Tissierellia bacterium]